MSNDKTIAARQPVEQSVEEDVYCAIADMIEPYVQREGINPNGALPASVHDSVAILLDHWLKTRQPAQAVDLGMQQDAARWRAIAPHLSVEWDEDEMLKRWTWIDFKGDALSVPTRTRESYASVEEAIDAVIDSKAVQS